ncbi:BnaA04g12010D [Brassica napus]|uniref:BnaA04g12010D protein n=1 Tax=Brassica napus TaxID=3708 RepID=A0A078FN83_BRANA|nr:BnaA04g12010D [Brassica napus]
MRNAGAPHQPSSPSYLCSA